MKAQMLNWTKQRAIFPRASSLAKVRRYFAPGEDWIRRNDLISHETLYFVLAGEGPASLKPQLADQ